MNFYERVKRAEIACEGIQELLGNDVEVQGFGVESIGDKNSKLRRYLSIITNNYNNPTAMMLEYLPDYIVYAKNKVFFLEIKVSTTPCWSKTRIKDANMKSAGTSINESNCGEIAREALLAYRKYYPDTVVLYVTNYNKNVVLAQYAKNIQCLRCEKNPEEKYDCTKCPLEHGFFDLPERNNSNGSGTPNTNINLDSFIPAERFFEREFKIVIDNEKMNQLKEQVLNEKLCIGDLETEKQKIIIKNLWESGLRKIRCPKCGAVLVERQRRETWYNDLLSCSNYNQTKCDFSVWVN